MHKCSQPSPSSLKSSGLTCIRLFCSTANTCPPPLEKNKIILLLSLSALACLAYLHILPGTAGLGRGEAEGEPFPRPGLAPTRKHGMHARTSDAENMLTCHLKLPLSKREAEGFREMNPSDVRVKSAVGGGGAAGREARRQLS